MLRSLATITALFVAALPLCAEDPIEALRSWTAFDNLTLSELASGKILTATNASMNLDRGMSSQAVFLVNAPASSTLRVLLSFNACTHPELEVQQHQSFRGESDAAFDRLQLNSKHSPTAALVRAASEPGQLQFSSAEISNLSAGQTAESMQQFLAGVLRERWKRFAREGEFGNMAGIDSGNEIRSLLSEEPKVAAHFGAVTAPLKANAAPGSPSFFYWEVSTVDKRTATQLGVVYSVEGKERSQVLDITFFSTSGYLVGVTLYELQPVVVEGKERTLVWQGSFISSVRLAGGFGIKRKIGSRMMLSSVERWAEIFRRDAEFAAK